MKNYEAIFIAKPTLSEELTKKLLSQIEGEIPKNGGSIENIENRFLEERFCRSRGQRL